MKIFPAGKKLCILVSLILVVKVIHRGSIRLLVSIFFGKTQREKERNERDEREKEKRERRETRER